MRKSLLLAVGLLSLAGCASQAPKGPPVLPAEAGIPLDDFGNIYDWRADGTVGIYLESGDRKWFHATFTAPCENLPFTEHIDIHSTPGQLLTKFDSIEMRGEDCFFKTMEQVPGPPAPKPPAPKPVKP